jgi:hypothetical protein
MIGGQKPKGGAHPINWRKGCLSLLLAYVGFPVVAITSFKIAYTILERPIISSLYGSDSYAKGLRATGKRGELSDHSGRRLPAGWFAVLAIGAFILSMLPVILLYDNNCSWTIPAGRGLQEEIRRDYGDPIVRWKFSRVLALYRPLDHLNRG